MMVDLTEQLHQAAQRNDDLEHALQSRVVIEQAKGVLHERLGLSLDDAFTLLRSAARGARRDLHELAAQVVAEKKTPPPIIKAVAKEQRWQAALHRERDEARRTDNHARARRLDKLTGQVQAHQRYIEDNRR